MLHQRHGDRIFQVMLYDEGIRTIFPDGWGECMAAQERASTGFDVAGSPFELLCSRLSGQPGVCLVDVAPGVIYIESSGDDERSKRIPGFITKEMLLQHKPFYEAFAGRSLKTAQEVKEYAK